MKFILLILTYGLFYFTGLAETQGNKGLSGNIIQTEDHSDDLEIKLYPNPVKSGIVTVETYHFEIREIRVIDIGGKEIFLKKIAPGTFKSILQVYEIPDGIYFIRIKSAENKTFVKKLVVSSN
jgi:hypothetical protein